MKVEGDKSSERKKQTKKHVNWIYKYWTTCVQVSIKQRRLFLLFSENPDCLGEKVKERFGGQLPFLFKVLSVNKVTILFMGTATFLR